MVLRSPVATVVVTPEAVVNVGVGDLWLEESTELVFDVDEIVELASYLIILGASAEIHQHSVILTRPPRLMFLRKRMAESLT